MNHSAASARKHHEPVRHALAEALGVESAPIDLHGPTVDAAGAAALLHTTIGAIYVRRARGGMPRPMSARPLVWRTADVLAMKEDERADRKSKRSPRR